MTVEVQAVQRRDHRRAGGQAVIDHDHNPPARINRGAYRRVLDAALADGLELGLLLGFDVGVVGAIGVGAFRWPWPVCDQEKAPSLQAPRILADTALGP